MQLLYIYLGDTEYHIGCHHPFIRTRLNPLRHSTAPRSNRHFGQNSAQGTSRVREAKHKKAVRNFESSHFMPYILQFCRCRCGLWTPSRLSTYFRLGPEAPNSTVPNPPGLPWSWMHPPCGPNAVGEHLTKKRRTGAGAQVRRGTHLVQPCQRA